MPPPTVKEEPEEPPKPAKNFFMDIYAQEVSKMQSVSKTSAQPKKRNFDATQFNAYGLPLGYRKGNSYENVDAFSRNNYVIVGSRTLHCEPPQVYQPTPEPAPPPPVCGACYGGYLPTPYPYPVPYYTGCCGCGAPCPHCVPVHPCQACAMMTMTAPYQPRPPRPNTLPGIQSLHTYGVRGRHDSPILPEKQVMVVAPVNAPVHMHPDPGRLGQSGLTQNTVLELVVGGSEVEKNSYPWMAALGTRGSGDGGIKWFCGGSLISHNMILTAAHCVQNSGFALDIVRLGAHNLGESDHEDVDDYVPEQVILHPEHNDSTSLPTHDIAIIVLQTEEIGVR